MCPLLFNKMRQREAEQPLGLGRSEQVVLHVYNTLHKAFEDAIHHFEYLENNPVRRRYKPRVLKRKRTFLTR